MNDDVLAVLERANPVPDPQALLAEPDDARRFAALVESRRHQPGVAMSPLGMPLRRGLLVAAAAAVVVLLVGSVFLFIDRSGPEDAVEPVPPSLVTTPPAPTTTPPAPTSSAPAPTAVPEPAPVGAAPFQDGLSLALFTDEEYTEPGGAVFHDGEWHLFYRTVDWDDYFTGAAILGWATSDDGRRFARRADLGTMEEIGVQGIQVTDAIVSADGTWALYYHTLPGASRGEVIRRMTAPGPEGPWTPAEAPVLEPGPAGSWDENAVAFGDVVAVGDEYWMFYDGLDATGRRSIGVATSQDGVNFQRRPEPVLVPEEAWETGVVFDPSVVVTDEGFVMTYLSRGVVDASAVARYAVGLATSDDGLTWVKHAANPIFELDRAGFTYAGVSSLLHTGDAYVWLADLESGQGFQFDASAWHLVHEGRLSP